MLTIKLCNILRGKNALVRSVYHGVHDLQSCYLAESSEICMVVAELSHLFGKLSFAAPHNTLHVVTASSTLFSLRSQGSSVSLVTSF